jgi:D-alanyl-D-alanine carboxypeptidase
MNQEITTVLPPELLDPLAEHTLIVPPREEPTPHVEESLDQSDETTTKPTPGRPLDTIVAIAVSVLVTGVVAGGAFANGSYNRPAQTASIASLPVATAMVPVPEVPNPYYGITLGARSAVVYDVHEDVFLFAQNETSKRSLASLTKIMTGIVASEHAKTQERIAVSPYAIETEGDSGLFANETWKLKDLISFVLMTSSNDGADALATAVGMVAGTASSSSASEATDAFVDAMNQMARDLKLVDTTFTNPTGLDEVGGVYGGEGTASDMAKITAYAWEHFPEILADSAELQRTYISEDGFIHEAKNTNKQVYSYTGLLGSKTGYTDYAGGNLAVVYDAGLDHPIVIVVLGSTLEGRFTDVKALIDATAEYMESGWYAYEAEHLGGLR